MIRKMYFRMYNTVILHLYLIKMIKPIVLLLVNNVRNDLIVIIFRNRRSERKFDVSYTLLNI